MLISQKMNDAINDQINYEQYSAQIYLAMAAKFENMGLKKFAQRFYMQVAEETMHAMKMFHYVLDTGGEVIIKGFENPPTEFKDVEEIITVARDHELKVTARISKLAKLSEEESDYASRSFLQWFITEQVEEVKNLDEILSLLKLAGTNGILYVENRLDEIMQQMIAAAAANPAG
jgi:ferritin